MRRGPSPPPPSLVGRYLSEKDILGQARGAYEPSIAGVFVETSGHALRLYMRGGRVWTCVVAEIEMRL